MSETTWLLDRFQEFGSQTALIMKDQEFSFTGLYEEINNWSGILVQKEISAGECIAIIGDFSGSAVALLFALLLNNCISIPIASDEEQQIGELLKIAEVTAVFEFTGNKEYNFRRLPEKGNHPLIKKLRMEHQPGLILFSSGSTGKKKASLLNFTGLLDKFKEKRMGYRTLVFLLPDHIGGLNTLLYVLTQGGTAVFPTKRNPEYICSLIAQYRIQLLPTTPTFLNMLLISEAYKKYDISSLEIITYGTEPMTESTLKHLHAVLPKVRLKQTYGLSELGILRTQSKDSQSLWVKVGGEGYRTKVIDNILWIKTTSAMLGYLNAPSPFDDEGWFNTGDSVLVDGEYMRILGRDSEIINVGGEKVYPAEVESVLLEMDNIRDAKVKGKPNPITGNIVTVEVLLQEPEDPQLLRKRIRTFCRGKLAPYKIPATVEICSSEFYGERFKKKRT